MRLHPSRVLAVQLILLAVCTSVWGQGPGQTPPAGPASSQIGFVQRIEGTVLVRPAGKADFAQIQERAPINIGDLLGTEQNSKAWWMGPPSPGSSARPPFNASHASLGQTSSLEFLRYDRDQASESFLGEAARGIVRFIKDLPQTNPPSSFTINTPTALVEALPSERPDDYVIEIVNERLTVVYCIWGSVRVRNISNKFSEERILRSCQKVNVEIDKEPGPITGASPQLLLELIKRTTIPNTLPEDVPDCSGPAPVMEEGFMPPGIWPPEGCPCPPGEEWVGGYCKKCPSWRPYDPVSCICAGPCRDDRQCRKCERCRDGRCYGPKCAPGEFLNYETCRCERKCDKTCPPGTVLDWKTCECRKECHVVCPHGQWLNPETCQCVPHEGCNKTCLPNQVLDPKTCTCLPKCNIICGPNEWLNYKTCQCERRCNLTCQPGYVLNRERCVCEQKPPCSIMCPPNTVLDPETCRCIGVVPKLTGCKSNAECGAGMLCRNGQCVKTPTDSGCTSNGQCGPGMLCRNGQCVKAPTDSGCSSDGQCGPGMVCRNRQCVKQGQTQDKTFTLPHIEKQTPHIEKPIIPKDPIKQIPPPKLDIKQDTQKFDQQIPRGPGQVR
jgi:hypothetical protein